MPAQAVYDYVLTQARLNSQASFRQQQAESNAG